MTGELEEIDDDEEDDDRPLPAQRSSGCSQACLGYLLAFGILLALVALVSLFR